MRTKLDTNAGIKRRKILTLDAMKCMRHISQDIKISIFNAYAASIILYNSETWTLTASHIKQIDSFHRRLKQTVLHGSRVITNEDLYRRTKAEPWSKPIYRRRLNWLGHVVRLDEKTPARVALKEYLSPMRIPVGRPALTWLNQIETDLNATNVQLNLSKDSHEQIIITLEKKHKDCSNWRIIIRDAMDGTHPKVL